MTRWEFAQLSPMELLFSHSVAGRLDHFGAMLGEALDQGKSTDKHIRYKSGSDGWSVLVAALGDAGWELVGFDQHSWAFKMRHE